MSFKQLAHVCRIDHGRFPHHALISEWEAKRQHLAVYLRDLPKLVEEYRQVRGEPYENNPSITLIDSVPKLRLSSACEASTNCLYGMAEIAAQFANKATNGSLPASFNGLQRKLEKNESSTSGLSRLIGDFEWYRKIRELRTEWTHYSTVTVGLPETNGDVIIVVRCHRRPSDRIEFRGNLQVKMTELTDWIGKAIVAVDNLGDYLLLNHILPKLELQRRIGVPKYDSSGWPIIRDGQIFESEQITVEEYLARCGISVSPVE